MSPAMWKLFGRRQYLHFDEPIPIKAAHALATDGSRVAKWGFLPFIRCDIVTKKIRRKDGKLEEKEKVRPICYAAHKDAAIYSYYGHLLSTRYEAELASSNLSQFVTAFRPASGKCNIDFALEAFDAVKAAGDCVALAFDVEGFFDNLDHAVLKQQWCRLLKVQRLSADHFAVFRSLTRFATVRREVLFKALGISPHNPRAGDRKRLCAPEVFRKDVREAGLMAVHKDSKGIPQGSPASAVLSNIYMLDFDKAVSERVAAAGGFYRRYCDDILCVVPAPAAPAVETFVMETIAGLKLTINAEKTKRHTFHVSNGQLSVTAEPLQYLGFLFDGRRVLIRTASIARFYRKLRAGVRFAALTKAKHDKLAAKRGSINGPLKTRKLNLRYSYVGRHNFVSYALRAARKMDEESLKSQIKPHWKKLNAEIQKANQRLSPSAASRQPKQP
jgi:RNA-directed DNA polymerase